MTVNLPLNFTCQDSHIRMQQYYNYVASFIADFHEINYISKSIVYIIIVLQFLAPCSGAVDRLASLATC